MGSNQAKGGLNFSSITNVEDPNQPDWVKMKSLREIETIRATKKELVLNKLMEEYVTGGEQLSVVPGHVSFMPVKIKNLSSQREVYTVHVSDPDDKFLNQKEMQLVVDKVEWRYWAT